MLEVISVAEGNESVKYEFYLQVPAGNNSTGKSWLDAIRASKLYSVLRHNDIDYIKTEGTYNFSSTELTNQQRLVELQTLHTTLKTTFLEKIQTELKFTGYQVW